MTVTHLASIANNIYLSNTVVWATLFLMGGEHSRGGLIFSLILVGLVGVVAGGIVVTIYYLAVGWFNRSRRRATSPLNRRQFPQTNQIFQYSKELSNQEDRPSSSSISMVQSNPIFRYSKQCEVEACSVCLCEFKEGEEVRLLPECLHLFHVACVDSWLNSFSTCPICRADTMPPLNAVLSLPNPAGTSRAGAGTPQVAGFGSMVDLQWWIDRLALL